MRILRISGRLYPDTVGGVGLHVHEMSKLQAKQGHDVTVITFDGGENERQEYTDGYKIIRVRTVLKLVGNPICPAAYFQIYKMYNNYDVVHAHSHLFFSTNLCALVRRLKSSPPLVITNHGLMSQTAPMWLQKIYIPTIAKWTFNSADRIICYTENEKSMLVALGIDINRISIIHNGIDTSLFVPNNNTQSNNQILWIGRFVPGKGTEYLIEAFKILLKVHTSLKLLMIGQGPLNKIIKQKICVSGLSKNIIMKEFIPNSDLPSIYQNSDVFVLPSIDEGVPRTILEAMSCGIPVVCTELPQLFDIVKECGITVPMRDPQALANAISRILSDKDLYQKLSRSGRKTVVENYSWDDSVNGAIKLYKELIEHV